MKRAYTWTVLVLLLFAGATPIVAERPDRAERPDSVSTRHVVIISIDGLRPDAIEEFGLSTLQGLMAAGSYSLEASTIVPSKTLPSHASMLTGMSPSSHGIDFNSQNDDFGIIEVPTIFEIVRGQGYTTAAFYSKAKFRHLDRADSYDYRQAPAANIDNWMATRTVPDAIRYMRHRTPNLLFVHISETDYAGHSAGWMSFFYGLAARRADAAVARLVEAAEETYGADGFTLILTADHGGHGRHHGSADPLDTTIPWIIYGQGVIVGVEPMGIRTMDTAATALWLLGIPVPESFEGRPVIESLAPRKLTVAGG